jgi:hypothetical protein
MWAEQFRQQTFLPSYFEKIILRTSAAAAAAAAAARRGPVRTIHPRGVVVAGDNSVTTFGTTFCLEAGVKKIQVAAK